MRAKTVGLVIALSFLFATGALADSQARIVRLSYVEGGVQIDRSEGQQFIHAFLNMPVVEGSRLTTAEDGRAEVEFEDGSTVRLTPNTEIYFPQLRLRADGARVSNIELQRGTAYFHLKDRDQYTVFAAGQEFSPKKSSAFRVQVSTASNELQVAVLKGHLEVFRSTGERVDVRKNETLSFDLSDVSRYYLSRGINAEAFDYWDRERDQRHSVEYASNYGYSSYSPNYVYGFPDLYRYGSFFVVNGYGYVWQPYGVGPAWDPYNVGYWVWYPGFGYTWVSPYPWGWTPYRYGTWVFVGNYGWCWRPGSTWNNWNAFTPVVNSPVHRQVFNHPPRTRTSEVIAVGTPGMINHTGDIPGRRRTMTEGDLRPGRPNGDGISIVGPGAGASTAGGAASGFSHRPDRTTPVAGPAPGTVDTGVSTGASGGSGLSLNRGGRPARDAGNSNGSGTNESELTGDAPRPPDVTVIHGTQIAPAPTGSSAPTVTVDRPARSEHMPEPDRTPRASPPEPRQSPPSGFSRPERVSPPPSAPPRSSAPSFNRPAPSSPPPFSAPSRTSSPPRSPRLH